MTSNKKSYSKFTFADLKTLGLRTVVVDLFPRQTIAPIAPSNWLTETLARSEGLSLNTEKAKSEFLIAPILNELRELNKSVFAVYSGFNFTVDAARGLQGFCGFLLAKLPLSIVPETPIIAVVEAKLNQDLSAAIPQCAAEMYATQICNEQRGESAQIIYGTVTTGDAWLFLRLDGNTVEVDSTTYYITQLDKLLGVWQYIIHQIK